eukprot:scaffold53635_cov75-Phaeocystis_antarctica.AAC.4
MPPALCVKATALLFCSPACRTEHSPSESGQLAFSDIDTLTPLQSGSDLRGSSRTRRLTSPCSTCVSACIPHGSTWNQLGRRSRNTRNTSWSANGHGYSGVLLLTSLPCQPNAQCHQGKPPPPQKRASNTLSRSRCIITTPLCGPS